MVRSIIAAVVLLLTVAAAIADARPVAFVNVNVISMQDEGIERARTVIVTGDRISAIGSVDATVVPDEAEVVDGTDRFLMPGLAEMHGHVTSTSPTALDRLFGLYVANGVTTVRGMLGRPPHIRLREQLLSQEILGPVSQRQ